MCIIVEQATFNWFYIEKHLDKQLDEFIPSLFARYPGWVPKTFDYKFRDGFFDRFVHLTFVRNYRN